MEFLLDPQRLEEGSPFASKEVQIGEIPLIEEGPGDLEGEGRIPFKL